MKCWHCKSELIWGADHTFEDYCLEGDGIVTNLSCSECEADVLIYLGEKNAQQKSKIQKAGKKKKECCCKKIQKN